MLPNVGPLDRLFRLIFGIGLIGASLYGSALTSSTVLQYAALAIGLVAVVTATLRICPLYRLIGIRTCDCE